MPENTKTRFSRHFLIFQFHREVSLKRNSRYLLQYWVKGPLRICETNKLFVTFNKINVLEKKIMVSHLHASDTKAEFSGIEGEEVLRKAIEKFQPDVFLSGHIHEAEGLNEKIGKTRVFSLGKKGRVIEL